MKLSSFSLCPIVIAAPSQAFFHLVLSPEGDVHHLVFSVKNEDNIRYYQVEGSYDLITFEKLTRIHAKGNTDLPRTYKSVIYDTSYTYYRVRQVDDLSAEIISNAIPADKQEEQEERLLRDPDQDYKHTQYVSPAYAF